MLSAFEGPYAFSNYNKPLEEKNVGEIVHLIRNVGGKSLSTLKWESGLRGRFEAKKKKIHIDNMENLDRKKSRRHIRITPATKE